MNKTSFEDAFDSCVGTYQATCACGKEYYDIDTDMIWDWEESERGRLEKDPDATAVDGATGYIEFEGQQFVRDCDCWKARSKQVMNFIDGHARQIAKYLNSERDRKIREAQKVPPIDLAT